MSGMEFNHPIKRGAHWVELETDMTDDKITPDAMERHVNQLTAAEAERLAMLAEECAEVIQVIGKILRHGYDSYHPDNSTVSNRDLLAKEATQVVAILTEMKLFELIDYNVTNPSPHIWEKKLRYTHYQEPKP
jgi:hypothetical protein